MTNSLLFVLLLIMLSRTGLRAQGQLVLSTLEKAITAQISVPNLAWEDLKASMASSDSTRYLIFDTRPTEEYDVSHLPHAIQIDPQLPAQDFFQQYGDSLKNKNLVFYCSVGYRSSLFLQRVQKELQARGAQSAGNLRGGIFRWYNEGNVVVDAEGPTDEVHPYDKIWGALIEERKKKE